MEISKFWVKGTDRISDIVLKMEELSYGILLVGNNEILEAVITDGDIRRYLLKSRDLTKMAQSVATYSPIVLNVEEATEKKIKNLFIDKKIKAVPIIKANGKVQRLEFDNGAVIYSSEKQDAKVVIMAGGKGTRLAPLTSILPKPLIPVGDKTIIEHIIDRFSIFGFRDFDVIVNYKKELIKAFFSKDVYENKNNVNINLFEEKNFQGTAGGLKLLEKELTSTFILSNCDILINADYGDIVENHISSNNFITMVIVPQKMQIPYGTIELDDNDEISEMKEKPSIQYYINSGVYAVSPEVLNFIEEGEFIHFTDLIMRCKNAGKKIGVYKIKEDGWMDMGEMNELKKMELNFS